MQVTPSTQVTTEMEKSLKFQLFISGFGRDDLGNSLSRLSRHSCTLFLREEKNTIDPGIDLLQEFVFV